jgi:hypothetical protein
MVLRVLQIIPTKFISCNILIYKIPTCFGHPLPIIRECRCTKLLLGLTINSSTQNCGEIITVWFTEANRHTLIESAYRLQFVQNNTCRTLGIQMTIHLHPMPWWRISRSIFYTGIPNSHLHRLITPDDILIQFDLLIMNAVTLETCREMKYINTWKSASRWFLPRISRSLFTLLYMPSGLAYGPRVPLL